MTVLAPALNAETIRKMFVPVMVTLAKDPVANIRMNVAKTLKGMSQ